MHMRYNKKIGKTYYYLEMLIFILILLTDLVQAGFKNVTDYDEKILKSVVKICDVSYGMGSSYREELEKDGWEFWKLDRPILVSPALQSVNSLNLSEIKPLSPETVMKNVGVVATNGPLTVISYAGTSDIATMLKDMDIRRAPLSRVFKRFPDHLQTHNGFLDYYSTLERARAAALFNPQMEDETYILAGHSLGGAMAQLGAFDIFNNNPANYSEGHNLSVLTFGSPSLFNLEASKLLNLILPYTSHSRVTFHNDFIANFNTGFVHTGQNIQLGTYEGPFGSVISTVQSHFLGRYIDNLSPYHMQGYGHTSFSQKVFGHSILQAMEHLKSIDEDFCEQLPKNKEIKLKQLPSNIELMDQFFSLPFLEIKPTLDLVMEQPGHMHHICPVCGFLGGLDNVFVYQKYRNEIFGLFVGSNSQKRGYKDYFMKNLLMKSEKIYPKMSRLSPSMRLNIIKNIIKETAEKIFKDSEEDFLPPPTIPSVDPYYHDIFDPYFSDVAFQKFFRLYEERSFKELIEYPEENFEDLKNYFSLKRDRKRKRLLLAKMVNYNQCFFEENLAADLKKKALDPFDSYSYCSILNLANPRSLFEKYPGYLTYFQYNEKLFRETLTYVESTLLERVRNTNDYKCLAHSLKYLDNGECKALGYRIEERIERLLKEEINNP